MKEQLSRMSISETFELKSNFYEINGIRLFVEEMGEGEPILMIPGLGAGSWLWHKSLILSNKYRLVMPHLRGSGRSDKPDHRYSIEQFSDDLNCLMEELLIDRFHVAGISMGGFVAQTYASTWTEKVQSLILVCTSAGGSNQIGPDGDTLSRMIRLRGKTRKERLMDAYKLNFTEEFMKSKTDEINRITEWRIKYPQPEFAYYRQLIAGSSFPGVDLKKINGMPTLIIGGKDDTMVPPEDTRILHTLIFGSELVMFEGKHMFFIEHPDSFNNIIAGFFEEHPIKESDLVYR